MRVAGRCAAVQAHYSNTNATINPFDHPCLFAPPSGDLPPPPPAGSSRPRLKLAPRTKPIVPSNGSSTANSSIFGGAKPRVEKIEPPKTEETTAKKDTPKDKEGKGNARARNRAGSNGNGKGNKDNKNNNDSNSMGKKKKNAADKIPESAKLPVAQPTKKKEETLQNGFASLGFGDSDSDSD